MANTAYSAYTSFADRYRTITGAPTLYTFDAPAVAVTTGTQVYPTYAVLFDDGTTPSYADDYTCSELTNLRLHIYAATLALVDAAVELVKYNGGGVAGQLGMDFGVLTTLITAYGNLSVQRVREHRFAASATGETGQRIYGAELAYQVAVYRYT